MKLATATSNYPTSLSGEYVPGDPRGYTSINSSKKSTPYTRPRARPSSPGNSSPKASPKSTKSTKPRRTSSKPTAKSRESPRPDPANPVPEHGTPVRKSPSAPSGERNTHTKPSANVAVGNSTSEIGNERARVESKWTTSVSVVPKSNVANKVPKAKRNGTVAPSSLAACNDKVRTLPPKRPKPAADTSAGRPGGKSRNSEISTTVESNSGTSRNSYPYPYVAPPTYNRNPKTKWRAYNPKIGPAKSSGHGRGTNSAKRSPTEYIPVAESPNYVSGRSISVEVGNSNTPLVPETSRSVGPPKGPVANCNPDPTRARTNPTGRPERYTQSLPTTTTHY